MANEPATSPSPSDATAPRRVTRTFAQDVARLTGKGEPPKSSAPVPAPLKPKREEVPEPPPPPPPAPRAPAPEPPPAYIIPKAPTTDESREAVLARLRAKVARNEDVGPVLAAVAPTTKAPSTDESREAVLARLRGTAIPTRPPEPVRPPAAKPAPVPAPERIHTYKSDFSEHIDEKGASTFSVLAAQADAGTPGRVIFKEKKPFPVALVAGTLLLLVGGAGVYGAYYTVTNRTLPVFAPNVPSLVTADERRELSGTGTELAEKLAALAEEPLAEGRVRIAYTTYASTTQAGVAYVPQGGGALIAALALPMPDILARSVLPESTVGIVHAGTESRAFFILRVDSFERSFAGMLAWEPTVVGALSAYYPSYAAETATTSASSTAPVAPTVAVTSSGFADAIVGNRDVRVLRDTAGRSIMLYGFRDKETLIIARDEAAYAKLIERLSSVRGQ